MNLFAAIISAIAQVFSRWRELLKLKWKFQGRKIAHDLENAKTDEEREKLADRLLHHLRDKP